MAYTVRDLPSLVLTATANTVTGAIGHLDDASSITLYITSSAGTLTSGLIVQVSQFDPADTFPVKGVTQSSNFYNVSSSNVYTSGVISLSNISFRGLRFSIGLTSGAAGAGETVAFATKQISV